jgi:hypothetical protein
MISVIWLVLAILLWIGILHGIAWTWNRHVAVMLSSGIQVDTSDQHMTIWRVASYHTVDWTVTFFILFLILELATFPLWQILGLAGLLSLYFGTAAVAKGENEWIGRDGPGAVSLFGRLRDAIWYRTLMVLEWFTHLAVLVLVANLIFEPIS